MGLSSSQARLLHLTTRMHQIEYKAAKVEAEKLQMANESDRVYNEYLEALDATKIQYSTINTDGSLTYLDANYRNICMGYHSNNPTITSWNSYQLINAENGKIYLPADIQNAYVSSSSLGWFKYYVKQSLGIPATPPGGPVSSPRITENEDESTLENNSLEDDLVINTPTEDPQTNYTISIGESLSNIQISNATNLSLTNHNGDTYSYTLSGNNGTATINRISYGINGRLVISGNNLNIVAQEGQEDNIVLFGNNNYINTGDGNDRIRVGYVQDSDIESASNENTIIAGDGNDYIQISGYANNIDGGEGEDNILFTSDYANLNQISNVENSLVVGQIGSSESDGEIGWSLQGDIGNCRTLALLNSLSGQQNISNFVTIEENGDSYQVTFNNYTSENGNTIELSKSDLEYFSNRTEESGDIDTILIERAMDAILRRDSGSNIELSDYNSISEILFGNDNVYMADTTNFNAIKEMFEAYQNGEISNFIVGTGSNEDKANGIIAAHAYSVVNVGDDYIELLNPWDSNDSIVLDSETFDSYFNLSFVFGATEGQYEGNGTFTNVIGALGLGSSGEGGILGGLDALDSYLTSLYTLIQSCSGIEVIDDTMLDNVNWVSNVLKAGAVFKMIDLEYDWNDISVSTTTHLQEVENTVALKRAEAKYEADMRKIDNKERKYDAELASFDNERNAIKQEMDTLKNVAKENVERTFKLFS